MFDPSMPETFYRGDINDGYDRDSINASLTVSDGAASAETSVLSSVAANAALGSFDEIVYTRRAPRQVGEIAYARAGNPTETPTLCTLVPKNCPPELVEKYSFPLYALEDESYEDFSGRLINARGERAYLSVGIKSESEKIRPLTAGKSAEAKALFEGRYVKLVKSLMDHKPTLVGIKPALHLTYEK